MTPTKARHCWLGLLAIVPLSAGGAEPYKEPLGEQARSKQPVVYARVDDHGYGLQYWRQPGSGLGMTIGSLAGGLAGALVGAAADRIASSGPTELAQEDVERLMPVFDRAALQLDLESALNDTLGKLPLFPTPPVLLPLAPGAPSDAAAFTEDAVLVVELYASLIANYRALQVTAVAYVFNPPQDSRVYLNRFDYVSDFLPMPPIKSKEDIKTDVEAVKAKYRGRRLTPEEKQIKSKELRAAAEGTTLEQWREPLMDQWLASDGAKLKDAMKRGTATVAQLLGRDLMDFSPVDVRRVRREGWKVLDQVDAGRYTMRFIGGPFAGTLMSEPPSVSNLFCQGTAFSATSAKSSLPKLCEAEGVKPGVR